MSCRAAVVAALLVAALGLPGEARAACAPTSPVNNANVTCTGTTTDQNSPFGYGTVTDAGNTIAVVPGATVTGTDYGIVFNNGTVLNSGAISGSNEGIYADVNATVSNSGTISGGTYGIRAGVHATVSNSGIISGGTDALYFSGAADTLTLLPGSILIGPIHLGGGGDTVNFRVGNQNLTFDSSLSGTTVTSTVPYVVSSNQLQVVTVDPTPFAMTERNLMDFTGGVSSVLDRLFGAMDGEGSGQAVAFAPDSGADTRIADDFAHIPGASAYAQAPAVFANPTAHYADGTTVWGRGFAGERTQPQDGALIRTIDRFYGGMIGADRQVNANLRLGGFLGGGETRDSEDFNMGGDDSNLVFGGAFGRYDWGGSFLGLALQGGVSRTNSTRNINNNLMGGGIETATASYNGWYVSPQATYGRHYGLGSFSGADYTLTPSATLRYLYGSFGGYTESGSTANMTVGARSVSDVEERGELTLTRTAAVAPGQTLVTDIFGGILGNEHAGDSTVNASLLGQAVPFAAPGASNV